MISVSGMTLPGLSGSFILILLGNYVLLLVDSVNALYDTMAEMLQGDFSFTKDEVRLRTLLILGIFTAGSATGLVTLSHILGYVLKRFKHNTTAMIIGFITGSLGVVWPWKRSIYLTESDGSAILDTNGDKIIVNYERYWPEMNDPQSWWSILFIVIGIGILIALEWYGKKQNKNSIGTVLSGVILNIPFPGPISIISSVKWA